MNWYKIAISKEDAFNDYYEGFDYTFDNQIYDFKGSRQEDYQHWEVIPISRLKKIWSDYMKMGFVRDEKGINDIAELIVKNIQKAEANTIMYEHTGIDPIQYVKDRGFDFNEDEHERYSEWLYNKRYNEVHISDYAMNPLVNKAISLIAAQTSEEKLQIIDSILNIIHQRSDIAAWFVEGGIKGLNELKNQII